METATTKPFRELGIISSMQNLEMLDSDWSIRFQRARATKNACKIVGTLELSSALVQSQQPKVG